MNLEFMNKLALGFRARLPLILQTEAAECGLACLGMVAAFHGHRTDLPALRERFAVSLKGTTLESLIQMASALKLASRPVKLDLDSLDQLSLPCILHWDFNHFVVLQHIGAQGITVHDPATGVRRLSWDEVSRSFTGVALELWPQQDFTLQAAEPAVPLHHLLGRVNGLRRSFVLIVLLALALEVFSIASPFYLQWVIDHGVLSANRSLLVTLAIGFGLVMLMQRLTTAVRGWALLYLSTTLNIQWRANVFTHLVRLPMAYFERRLIGDVVSRFGAIDQIQHTLTTAFLEAILDGVMTFATLAMMWIYSPLLASIALACIGLYALIRLGCYGPLRRASEENIVHAAKQASHFLETIRGARAIKLFQRQDQRRSGWLALLVDEVNAGLRIQKLLLLYQLLNGVLFQGATILIVWIAANQILDSRFTVGLLVAFLAYKAQFDERVGSLIDKLFQLRMLRMHGARLADIVLTPPETARQADDPVDDRPLGATIDVVGLRYRYAPHEPWVLDNLHLRIGAGESVALVGPSGCGKTTLMNVLLGSLPPTEGDVLVGGRSVQRIGIETLRRHVGTVLQDDMLFAGSIAGNISFFDPKADIKWVEHCARLAAVDDEIQAMPMGYDTLVGDMGTVLSGGQKQRVLLARALYKRPSILFLDEATSHLDVHKEQEVNAAIRTLNITRVIVAHRPETIASVERVLLLHRGQELVERTPLDHLKTLRA